MSRRGGEVLDDGFDDFAVSVWPRLRWSAYLLTGDRHLAEDLAQTALARTYAAWSRVRRDDAFAYSRRVMVNANTDRLRRRRVTEVLGGQAEALQAAQTRVEERDLVVRLLSHLTERERRVVVLRYYFDLSEAAVAEELRISRGTVKSTSSKALAKIRAQNGAETLRGVS